MESIEFLSAEEKAALSFNDLAKYLEILNLIKSELDKYVIGQDEAKITLSVAIYNHYKRINSLYENTKKDNNDVDVDIIPINQGETIFICTDGLYEYITPEVMFNVIKNSDNDEPAKVLLDMANEAGGKDNITVVTVEG